MGAVLSSHMGGGREMVSAGRWFLPPRSFLAQPIHATHRYTFFRRVPNTHNHTHTHTPNQ